MSYTIGSEEWNARQAKAARDNRANQLNPNNDAYYSSRGITRPGSESESDSGSNALAIAAAAIVGVTAIAGIAALAIHKFFGKKEEKAEICEVEPIESIELDDDIEDEQGE